LFKEREPQITLNKQISFSNLITADSFERDSVAGNINYKTTDSSLKESGHTNIDSSSHYPSVNTIKHLFSHVLE
jgi:hypothetical protein